MVGSEGHDCEEERREEGEETHVARVVIRLRGCGVPWEFWFRGRRMRERGLGRVCFIYDRANCFRVDSTPQKLA